MKTHPSNDGITMSFTRYSRPRPLRILTDDYALRGNFCNVCSYLQIPGSYCDHHTHEPAKRPASPCSDCSFYTAPANPSVASFQQYKDDPALPASPTPSSHSDTSIASRMSIQTAISSQQLRRAPSLRRTRSPTETSLRDIWRHQASLQAKQSEDQLRTAYERQTLCYLDSTYACLDSLAE